MNSEEAFKVIDELVFVKAGRHLDQAEKIIIEAAWLDKDYKEVAEKSPYTVDRLQRDVGRKLWILLTGILGNGEKVTKKRLRAILERRTPTPNDDSLSDVSKSNTSPHIVGGQPPEISSFYGRTAELTTLKKIIVKQRCVALIGVAGIGKSALAAKLIKDISAEPESRFDCVIWKSVAYAPLVEDLVTELIKLIISGETESGLPEYTQAKISVLVEHLRSHRCLVVLDAVEAIERGNNFNLSSKQRAEYEVFFRRLVEEQHQSCLFLTSQMPLDELAFLESAKRPVQSIKIEGLKLNDARQLLHSKGLTDPDSCQKLIQTYRGNPSELESVAQRIHHFFGGSSKKFVERQTTFVSPNLKAMLNRVFENSKLLSELQRQILIYLAESISQNSAPVSFTELLENLRIHKEVSVSTSEMIAALEGLEAQSLIESSGNSVAKEIGFSLRPAVKKYILTDPLGLVRKNSTTIKSA